MGFIKEPKGIDFLIKSEPLTDKDRKEISEYIKNYKEKNQNFKSENPKRKRNTPMKEKS